MKRAMVGELRTYGRFGLHRAELGGVTDYASIFGPGQYSFAGHAGPVCLVMLRRDAIITSIEEKTLAAAKIGQTVGAAWPYERLSDLTETAVQLKASGRLVPKVEAIYLTLNDSLVFKLPDRWRSNSMRIEKLLEQFTEQN